MARLDGKNILVTGGTSGIGLETARQFLSEGARVAITGRNPENLAAAGRALGDSAWLIRSDAGVVDDQRRLAADLAGKWGRLDAAFLNAADVTHAAIDSWDEASYERVFAINLKGPFFLIQALLPILANPSSIILCGSVSAHIGLPKSSLYAASKAGLLSLARTLSGEFVARGIRVNGLSPGPTETPALQKLGLAGPEEAALRAEIQGLVPIGRMGKPTEIAKAAVFLASDESSYVVGTELLVDGGVGNL